MTQLIKQYSSGLGSRLQKDQNGNYLAYAKWRNSNDWENTKALRSHEAEAVNLHMNEACNSIKTLFQLNEVHDLIESD